VTPVIAPVPSDVIRRFLSERAPLTRFRGLEVHTFHGLESEALLDEIGRLRELGFRAAGAGRGLAKDLDDLDVAPLGYEQLVAWDPMHGQLAAMLRFQMGSRAVHGGLELLRTHRLFDYREPFSTRILPNAMELGRSLVNAEARRARLGLYAIWMGLGQLVKSREVETLFGNVTVYANYPDAAKRALVNAAEALYGGAASPLVARPGLRFMGRTDIVPGPSSTGSAKLQRVKAEVQAAGASVPTMLQSYLQLGPDVTCGETVLDADFGDALELGIVVPRAAIARAWSEAFGLASRSPRAV
jgi:hypothetical protein